jgi:hypothetical protein
MKKIITLLLFSVSLIVAFECDDPRVQATLGPNLVQYFNGLDRQTAQAIQSIIRDIQRAHETIEKQNQETTEHMQELDKQYYLSEQEILFNQVVINKLHGVDIDSINNQAILQNSKQIIKEIIDSYADKLESIEGKQQ